MDNNLIKKLNDMLYKIPKKDLVDNLNKAKKFLNNSNKEDLDKLINSKAVSDILGKDKEKIKTALENNEIKTQNIEEIEDFLDKNT